MRNKLLLVMGVVLGCSGASTRVMPRADRDDGGMGGEDIAIDHNDARMDVPSDVSMMPDEILKTMSEYEFRSLIAYLQHPQQVPMLATTENAKDLFNGRDAEACAKTFGGE